VAQPAKEWTIADVLRWAADDFRARGIESPRLDAEVLLARALGTTRIQLVVDAQRVLPAEELARFREMVKRRRAHEPVAYILGEREFWGRVFRVDRRVLVPRPDLCTGSGCVAISLAKERPTSVVYATDASEDALSVARENALRLGAYNVALRTGDLYAAVDAALRFDVITANPPYIARGEMATLMQDVRDFEPRLALEAGDDGLDVLRRVVAGAPAHLVAGGVLAVEVGAGQAPAVAELFRGAGFDSIELRRDYARIERVVSGVLPSL